MNWAVRYSRGAYGKYTIETKYGNKWGRRGHYWVISDIGGTVRAESFGAFPTKEEAMLDAKIVIGAVARDQLSMWVHVLVDLWFLQDWLPVWVSRIYFKVKRQITRRKRMDYNFKQPGIVELENRIESAYLTACEILLLMTLERKRPWWKFWVERWAIHHEPLRNDAARFLKSVRYKNSNLDIEGFKMVGDEEQTKPIVGWGKARPKDKDEEQNTT